MGLPLPKRAPRKYIVDIQLSRTQLEAFYAGSEGTVAFALNDQTSKRLKNYPMN